MPSLTFLGKEDIWVILSSDVIGFVGICLTLAVLVGGSILPVPLR